MPNKGKRKSGQENYLKREEAQLFRARRAEGQ